LTSDVSEPLPEVVSTTKSDCGSSQIPAGGSFTETSSSCGGTITGAVASSASTACVDADSSTAGSRIRTLSGP
jgi:hypothetical protein